MSTQHYALLFIFLWCQNLLVSGIFCVERMGWWAEMGGEEWFLKEKKSTPDLTWIIKFNFLKISWRSKWCYMCFKKNICVNDINGKTGCSKVNHTDNIKLPQEVPSQNPHTEVCLPTAVPFPIGLVKGRPSWSVFFNHLIPTLKFLVTTFLQAVFAPVKLGFPGNYSPLKCIFQAWNAGICTL